MKNTYKFWILFLLVVYFFAGYRIIGSLPHYISIKGSIFLDYMIPLIPFFIVFYLAGYLFVFLPVFIVKNRRQFNKLSLMYFLIITVSFIMFNVLPVELERIWATGSDLFSRITLFQQRIDSRFNNFPSLHVALNMFSFLIVKSKSKKLAGYLFPLFVLIVISTLLVKQHIIIDVAGGIIMALIFYWAYKKYGA